jgi:hypothetical protein
MSCAFTSMHLILHVCVKPHLMLTFDSARRHGTSSHLPFQPRSARWRAGQACRRVEFEPATTSLALDLRLRLARTHRHARLDLTSLCSRCIAVARRNLPLRQQRPPRRTGSVTHRVPASHPEYPTSSRVTPAYISLLIANQTSPSHRHHLCRPSSVSGFLPFSLSQASKPRHSSLRPQLYPPYPPQRANASNSHSCLFYLSYLPTWKILFTPLLQN